MVEPSEAGGTESLAPRGCRRSSPASEVSLSDRCRRRPRPRARPRRELPQDRNAKDDAVEVGRMRTPVVAVPHEGQLAHRAASAEEERAAADGCSGLRIVDETAPDASQSPRRRGRAPVGPNEKRKRQSPSAIAEDDPDGLGVEARDAGSDVPVLSLIRRIPCSTIARCVKTKSVAVTETPSLQRASGGSEGAP